jgi:hypothetical protein
VLVPPILEQLIYAFVEVVTFQRRVSCCQLFLFFVFVVVFEFAIQGVIWGILDRWWLGLLDHADDLHLSHYFYDLRLDKIVVLFYLLFEVVQLREILVGWSLGCHVGYLGGLHLGLDLLDLHVYFVHSSVYFLPNEHFGILFTLTHASKIFLQIFGASFRHIYTLRLGNALNFELIHALSFSLGLARTESTGRRNLHLRQRLAISTLKAYRRLQKQLPLPHSLKDLRQLLFKGFNLGRYDPFKHG